MMMLMSFCCCCRCCGNDDGSDENRKLHCFLHMKKHIYIYARMQIICGPIGRDTRHTCDNNNDIPFKKVIN